MKRYSLFLMAICLFAQYSSAKKINPYQPDPAKPAKIKGYTLVWNDEFNQEGKPDTLCWRYETGFVRNKELQWYQSDNATCSGGVLKIEGRRERVKNPNYDPEAEEGRWQRAREYAEYTSSSINTRGKKSWKFGRFEIRARIQIDKGSWPAIWTLGNEKRWPFNGEIDLMEFYIKEGAPAILANAAWGSASRGAKWDGSHKPLSYFVEKDPEWAKKFHTWRMDWTENYIRLYLDDELLNEIDLSQTINPDGFNPFHQEHYVLLNLAIGSNGGDPSETTFPLLYEVDYVRIYQ